MHFIKQGWLVIRLEGGYPYILVYMCCSQEVNYFKCFIVLNDILKVLQRNLEIESLAINVDWRLDMK